MTAPLYRSGTCGWARQLRDIPDNFELQASTALDTQGLPHGLGEDDPANIIDIQ
ncbi:MAG: hypothetical protein WEB31_00620 [Chthoniobacterales bacterium]